MVGVGAGWRFANMMELLIARKLSPRVGMGVLTVTVVLVLTVGIVVFFARGLLCGSESMVGGNFCWQGGATISIS